MALVQAFHYVTNKNLGNQHDEFDISSLDNSLLTKPLTDEEAVDERFQGMTLMHIAAEQGSLEMMKTLHSKCKATVFALDIRGGSPLLEAAAGGFVCCMEWFVGVGVDVNSKDQRGDTALHLAAGFNHTKALRWLITNGACIDSKTNVGVTPLLYATAKGNLDAVKILIEKGTDILVKESERGWGVIHTAAGCNQVELLKWLVNKFPRLLFDESLDGKTASTIAREQRCPGSVLALQKYEVSNKKTAHGNPVSIEATIQAERLAAQLLKEFGESTKKPKVSKSKKIKKNKATGKQKEKKLFDSQRLNLRIQVHSSQCSQNVQASPHGDWVTVSRRDRKKTCSDSSSSDSSSSPATKSTTPSNRWAVGKAIDEPSRDEEVEVNSRLRPHAPPWSPRRKIWTSAAANAGQIKLKAPETPRSDNGDAMENEFNRMLSKFTHMDTGARSTAKKKFARATAEYEQKRLADAAHVEESWFLSLRSKLKIGIQELKLDILESALGEIDEAVIEAPPINNQSDLHFLHGDLILVNMVKKAAGILQDSYGFEHQPCGKMIHLMQPHTRSPDSVADFRTKLLGLIDIYTEDQEMQYLWLRIETIRAFLVPIATELGFDFQSAQPGYVCLEFSLRS